MFKAEYRLTCFYSLLIFSLSCFAVSNSTADTIKEVTGYGKTQDAAVGNALVEAVTQIEGIGISKIRTVEKDLSSLTIISTGGQTITSTTPVSKDTILGRVKGYIKSYDVVSSKKEADVWKVVLRVTMEKYKALNPERDGLLKIVVYPFRMQDKMPFGVESSYIQEQISNNLITNLTQTGKFRVLDREYIQEYGSEVQQILSASSHPREALAIGQKLGADYILVGTVSYLQLETKGPGFYNDKSQQLQVTGDIDFRLIEVATQEVSLADTYSFTRKQKELRKALREKTGQQAIKEIIGFASAGISEEIMDSTFPIKILKVNSENSILFDQGGKRVNVGEEYEIYSGGSILKDTDTGLDIKIKGESVAKVKVSEVSLQYSSAKLISGSLSQIKQNAVVSRSVNQTEKEVPPARQTPGSSDAPIDWSTSQ